MLGFLQSTIATLIEAIKPQPLRRDGRRHLVAKPPMRRAEAVQWLWQGRLEPPSERFHPDPLQHPEDGAQGRFLFEVTPDEFVETREDFRERYLADGPGWTLDELLRATAAWLPEHVHDEILRRDEAGDFRRKFQPRALTFPGVPPWGEIVCWVGTDEWGRNIWMEIYNYFPESEQFYVDVTGSETEGHLVYVVYHAWNGDMKRFVEELNWRPSLASDEIHRINVQVFLTIVGAIADVFVAGGSQVVAQKIATQAAATSQAVLDSRAAGRRLFALALRRGRPTIVLYRGTTYRFRLGDPSDELGGIRHDLGPGIYFTDDPKLAATYAKEVRGTSDEPGIMLKAELAVEDLGNTLDLVNGPFAGRWDDLAEQAGKVGLWNEKYLNLLNGFLNEIGHKLDDFDTIIGPEYLRGGSQFRIRRNSRVYDKMLEKCSEIEILN
jgi:hypothetical protein